MKQHTERKKEKKDNRTYFRQRYETTTRQAMLHIPL